MRTTTTILSLLLLCVATACNSDDGHDTPDVGDIVLTCSPQSIDAPATGGTYTLSVACSRGEWTAFASDDSRAWMTVGVAGSISTEGTVTVTVAANTGTSARSGSVEIKSGMKSITVPVKQGVALRVSAPKVFSASSGETVALEITASADWSATSDCSWIAVAKTDSRTLTLTTGPNDTQEVRRGMVVIRSGDETATVEVEQNSAEDRDIVAPEGYRLVWNDEFNNGTTLSSAWTHEVKPAGWVNNELQTYVNGQAGGQRVTELVDGRLRINCFKGSDGKIYSGRVYANVGTGWQYGYIEARIKLPKGKGTWPAFWMMPVNFRTWPGDGEIDIMEEVGADANTVLSTIHCNKYNNSGTTIEQGSKYVATAESDYHVYACEWTADFLKFFIDGEQILNYRNDGTGYDAWPFDQPFYVILNLAWGGAWGGYKGVDDTALPVTMEVDYVRVFQKR